jgi:hypothetical protein
MQARDVRSAINRVSSAPTSLAVLCEVCQINSPKMIEDTSAGMIASPVIFVRSDAQFEGIEIIEAKLRIVCGAIYSTSSCAGPESRSG